MRLPTLLEIIVIVCRPDPGDALTCNEVERCPLIIRNRGALHSIGECRVFEVEP